MAQIIGLKSLLSKLSRRQQRARVEGSKSVVVGYTAAYALYVHENVEMKLKGKLRGAAEDKVRRRDKAGRFIKGARYKGRYWDPQGRGQAKFLEHPARTKQTEMKEIVDRAARSGLSLSNALMLAGLYLQRESQLIVPVDTGNLKASAFTRKD